MKTLVSDVTITLDGNDYPLRPSLKAASAISNQYGGFMGAYQALANGNLQAIQFIVRQAIPTPDQRGISTQELNEMVWRTGTTTLTAPISKYLSRLQNGGRDPSGEDDDDAIADEGNEGNGEI
ncbi:hypothetical protein [Pararhizobium haloflavum]|uniref:hypothetical protein n=1 Tax=Pararhizobium haloflavum TaxID=2037914 RepID=UPI000C197074|nr:hypothetical protein [Pararhizobium haloflavum]